MYYFCSLCGTDREDAKNWVVKDRLPEHLFKTHNHRLRTLDQILKDWGALGLIETSEVLPKIDEKNVLKLPVKQY